MLNNPYTLTSALIYELEEKLKNIEITESLMQNLIFKIKMDLKKDHPLYTKLPFYWNTNGPHSKIITDILKEKTQKPKISILKEYPEINNSLNFKNIKQLEKDIYRQYAPYLFMYKYKYGIYNPVKNKTLDIGNEELIDKLYFCQGDLPIKGYFNDFKLIYSTFTTNIDLLNDCNNFDKHWEKLEKIILDIWETFSKGLRVITKDTYYNNYTEKWDNEFKNALTPLENQVDNLHRYIEFDKIPLIEETEGMKRITQSTLGTYLANYYDR